MAPSKKKMVPTKRKRQPIPLEVKAFALDKYDEGIKQLKIIAMIKKRFGYTVIPSTVSTRKKNSDRIRSVVIDKFTSKEL